MRLALALMQSMALAIEILGVLTGANIALLVFDSTKGKRNVWDWLAILSGIGLGTVMAFMAVLTFKLVLTLV